MGSFVLKTNATGTALSYSTFFDPVRTNGITVDGSGNVYITGEAFGPLLTTTPNAPRPEFAGGSTDAFVASLDSSGSSVRYSTYLGGSAEDSGQAIQVDANGQAWVTGWSWSTDFPLAQPVQSQLAGRACSDVSSNPSPYRSQPCGDAFLAELSPDGNSLLYSTYFGGSRGSTGLKLQLDSSGNVWMLGTGSLAFTTRNPWLAGPCNNATENSVPAAEFSPSGSLLYASYVSGNLSVLVPSGTVRTLSGTTVVNILSPGSIRFSCMLNAASLGGSVSTPLLEIANVARYAGIIAPGEIVSIFGGGLGPDAAVVAPSPASGIGPQLAGVEVLFNGIPAPLLYVQNSQIMAVVPYGVAGASTGATTAEVQVRFGSETSQSLIFLVDATSPAVYSLDSSGVGQAAVLNEDGSINGPDNPAAKGTVVSIYATGGGLTNPPPVDGSINTGISTTLQLPVRVRFSEPIDAELLYAGPAPTLVSGAIVINARIPSETASGDHVPVSLYVGQAFSGGSVAIAVR